MAVVQLLELWRRLAQLPESPVCGEKMLVLCPEFKEAVHFAPLIASATRLSTRSAASRSAEFTSLPAK